jgi:hypothetical protein
MGMGRDQPIALRLLRPSGAPFRAPATTGDGVSMKQQSLMAFARLGVVLSLFAAACGDGEDEAETNGAGSEIEISGTWESNFGTTESISSDAWDDATIVDFDNVENVAITRNGADAEFNPGKYNRIVWTEPDAGSFYYCWVAFALDSEQEAEAAEATADATDPETTGCGGSNPWTKLSAK